MTYCFSPSNNTFHPANLKPRYKAAGTWPNDAVGVSNKVFAEFAESAPPEGKRRGVKNGLPAWEDVPPMSIEERAAQARAKRDRLLKDSDWVTLRATETGKPVPQAWDDYRQSLRDLTDQNGFPESIDWPDTPTGG